MSIPFAGGEAAGQQESGMDSEPTKPSYRQGPSWIGNQGLTLPIMLLNSEID